LYDYKPKDLKTKTKFKREGYFMKKSLVLVMALVLVVSFAFADEVGRATLGTDKGVITAGDPLNVSFTLTVEDKAEDVTTIEVMGDEVADNVFVMLIKDMPNQDATYEAQKVVDPDAQKTTYYIKAKELVGTKGNIYAELRDWNGEVVASATKEFAWKGTTWTDTLQLTPAVEGLYTVIAYIEFADGTRMELKGWEGYAQLVALDNYMKEVPGFTPEVDGANSLTVNAGVEFMYAKAAEGQTDATDLTYLGVYGEGSESNPSIVWTYTANGKPEFADVELVYAVNGDDVDDGDASDYASGLETDTAYIKFKVMQESFEEGDCCATAGDPKWALWFAIGTGEFHGGGDSLYQGLDFHVLGTSISSGYGWDIVKGAECRGWVKAIFYLDPSDVHIWLYAILGTDYYYDVAGQSDTVHGTADGTADETGYEQNFLSSAELNIIVEMLIKDVINLNFGLLDIPVTKDQDTAIKAFAAGNILLEGDAANVDLGGQFFTSNVASVTEAYAWTAHLILSGLDIDLKDFIMESINDVRVGVTMAGNQDGLGSVDIFACFEPGAVCCFPSFKVGMGMTYANEEFSIDQIFGSYTHALGEYGPVTLSGELGVIYSMGSAAVDNGQYGKELFAGTGSYDYAIGVGYEVTGTMTW
jgi:hypothetical protein